MKIRITAKNLNTLEVFEQELCATSISELEDLEDAIISMAGNVFIHGFYREFEKMFAALLIQGFYDLEDGNSRLYMETIE